MITPTTIIAISGLALLGPSGTAVIGGGRVPISTSDASPVGFDDDETSIPEPRLTSDAPSGLPEAYSLRPLTLPPEVFDVAFAASATKWTSSAPIVSLEASARYGVSSDLEVGLRLIRLGLSSAPGTGLDAPTGLITHRLLSGPVELAAQLEAELPLDQDVTMSARLPILIRIFGLARLDVGPGVLASTGGVWSWRSTTPLTLSLELPAHLRLFGSSELTIPDLRAPNDLLWTPGGGIAYVFGEDGRPSFELSMQVTSKSVVVLGDRPPDPSRGNYIRGDLALSLFFVETSKADRPLF